MPAARVSFQGRTVLELRSSSSRALIAPEAGGRLLLWEVGGKTVVGWPADPDWSKPAKIRGGNPLLFPFIARHFVDGVIGRWRDAAGTVRELPMHGYARDSVFDCVESAADRCTLSLMGRHPGYPFECAFLVTYQVGPDWLDCTFTVQNQGAEPLPWTAGHHFYFDLPPAERASWELVLPGARQARQREDGSIEDLPGPRERFALGDPALQDTFHLLPPGNVSAEARHPDGRTIRFELPDAGVAWHAVTTWAERPDAPFYCIEPWTGLPNAIHHGLGLRWTPPGATESARCRLGVTHWER